MAQAMETLCSSRVASPGFPVTQWEVISEAHRSKAQGERRQKGLESLARLYWKPIYAYIRLRWNRTSEESMDLTQEFFVRLLEGTLLEIARSDRGSFRAFLKSSLDNFVRGEYRRGKAITRGGSCQRVSIDWGEDPDLFLILSREPSAEAILDRHWRKAILEEALGRFERACHNEGRVLYLEAFRRYDLVPEDEVRPTYDELAQTLGVARTEVEHYLRQSRRRIVRFIREILSSSVRNPDELAAEEAAFFG